jgi:hypothetical protein
MKNLAIFRSGDLRSCDLLIFRSLDLAIYRNVPDAGRLLLDQQTERS